MVIDPGLRYSTFLGGAGTDAADSIAVDDHGNAYLAGFTASSNFPTTPGAFQPARAGNRDVFLTKLNRSGSALVYSTYLGGSDAESFATVAVDESGYAYVAGQTDSSDFPTTPAAFQATDPRSDPRQQRGLRHQAQPLRLGARLLDLRRRHLRVGWGLAQQHRRERGRQRLRGRLSLHV